MFKKEKFEMKKLEKYPNISVVIPAYNDAKTLDVIIPAILNQKYDGDIEIIVVDDCSMDNTIEVAKKHGVEVIVHNKNMGLASSINDGMKNAKYELVCVIEDDVLLVDDEWFKKLVPYLVLNDDVVCVSSPLILTKEVYNKLGFWEKAMFAWELKEEEEIGDEVSVVEYSEGSCDIWKKDVLLKIGGHDAETYRVSCEDVDICKRAAQKGYKVVSVPVPVYHLHSSHATGLSKILFFKGAHLSEGQGVLFRKYRFRAWSIDNQIFKTTAVIALFIPINVIRLLGIGYIAATVFGNAIRSYKVMRDPRVLFLMPPVKLLDYFLNVYYFWKGFITGRQRK